MRSAVVVLLASITSPALAAAAEPGGPWSLTYTNLTVLRVNPLGLQEVFDIGLQYRLSDSDSLLLKDTFAGIYSSNLLTPAFLNPGVAVKIQPLAVLRFEARWSWMSYLGNFDLVQSFPSPSADHSDSTIEERGERGLNYSTSGWNASFVAELRGKVGPVVARSRLNAIYHSMDLAAGDRLWYDAYADLLVPGKGWALSNDLDVLWQIPIDDAAGSMFMAGLRWSIATPIYGAEDFAPGEAQEHDNGPYQRLGPMFVYTFFDEPGAAFNKPSIIAIVNLHLAHRFRTGEDTPQALPYFVLGFICTGDLWRSGG